jgi:hypothetical protein
LVPSVQTQLLLARPVPPLLVLVPLPAQVPLPELALAAAAEPLRLCCLLRHQSRHQHRIAAHRRCWSRAIEGHHRSIPPLPEICPRARHCP